MIPKQAELLTLAGNEGRIQLVLRNGGDQNIEKTEGLSLMAVYGKHARLQPVENMPAEDEYDEVNPRRRRAAAAPPAPAVVVPPPPAPPVPVPDQVITIRGVEKKVEVFQPMKSAQDSGRTQ